MQRLKAQGSEPVASWWETLLQRRPFAFVGVGAFIGAMVFGYLFFPHDGRSWAEVWVSRGGAWALVAWGVAIIFLSCGMRGFSLRIYQWRKAKATALAVAEIDDLNEGKVEQGTG